jgi:hypothetical protein
VVDNWIQDVISVGKEPEGVGMYGTDGSMEGVRWGGTGEGVVSAACASNIGSTVALVKGGEVVAMHGEILGIIMAIREAKLRGTPTISIHSDYLNAVKRLIWHNDNNSRYQSMSNGKSWFKWLFSVWDDLAATGINASIHHVKAHTTITNTSSEPQLLNQLADQAARVARMSPTANWAPWPTFELDEFTAWNEKLGYIEQDLYKWTKSALLQQRATRVANRYPSRFSMILYERASSTNKNYYTKSPRDYGIKTQMLTRGNALMTNAKSERLFPGSNPSGPDCPHCGEIESDHHVFVRCPIYEPERRRCIEESKLKIQEMINSTDDQIKRNINTFIQDFFQDGELWPGSRSQYYLGHIPKITLHLDDEPGASNKNTLIRTLHGDALRITGYIWSLRMRLKYNLFAMECNERKRWLRGEVLENSRGI